MPRSERPSFISTTTLGSQIVPYERNTKVNGDGNAELIHVEEAFNSNVELLKDIRNNNPAFHLYLQQVARTLQQQDHSIYDAREAEPQELKKVAYVVVCRDRTGTIEESENPEDYNTSEDCLPLWLTCLTEQLIAHSLPSYPRGVRHSLNNLYINPAQEHRLEVSRCVQGVDLLYCRQIRDLMDGKIIKTLAERCFAIPVELFVNLN